MARIALMRFLLMPGAALAQGPAPNAPPGHWTRARDTGEASLSEAQREAAECLQAVGYLSGYRPGVRKGVTPTGGTRWPRAHHLSQRDEFVATVFEMAPIPVDFPTGWIGGGEGKSPPESAPPAGAP